jgi:hypothetical protein
MSNRIGLFPATTNALSFLRDKDASPISDMSTGIRLRATTVSAWASLSIFCLFLRLTMTRWVNRRSLS